MIPEIAIIGHPNEGKSSVLSTLAEDDSVRVSPLPGETTVCRTFPIVIDGKEVLRFTDTPGFQNPLRIVAELRKLSGSGDTLLAALMNFTGSSPEFKDDHELMLPVERGAGIIYVVDGSRPVRSVDRAEMEILRLIGRPRMAVINCKNDENQYLEEWKDEFRKHFNANRLFNAHRATYIERIELLETLKAIDQDWQQILSEIIDSFKKDWESRTRASAQIIRSLLSSTISLRLVDTISSDDNDSVLEKKLFERYSSEIGAKEAESHRKIRALFKHNIFNYELPPHSILREDLFSEKTWQLLGLTQKQLVLLGTISGAAVGAGIDIAALGHGLGLFTALGGIAGSIGALTGKNRMTTDASFMGVKLAGPQIQIGPAENISLLFVLVNRALLYYHHTINWAHGRRDYEAGALYGPELDAQRYTRAWSARQMKTCQEFFIAMTKDASGESRQTAGQALENLLFSALMSISRGE